MVSHNFINNTSLPPSKIPVPSNSRYAAPMASITEIPILTWTKDTKYLVSTDPWLLPLQSLNDDIFGADDFDWGRPLPPEKLRTLVQRSLCFGLYELHPGTTSYPASSTQVNAIQPQHPPTSTSLPPAGPQPPGELIGFARLITDLVTVHYLTDVYILPTHRNKGLGKWLMACIDEMFRSAPDLRGMILIAERGSRNEGFYRRYLGMGELQGGGFCMDRKGRGA
jgi:hypothetical protein